MRKYLAVFKNTWEGSLVYRLNFTLWRVRSVLQLLVIYFVWWTVFQSQSQVFGYTENLMLTYVMVAALIRAIVLSTRVLDVAGHINQGDFVNFLIKPLGIISFYFSRDLADKLLNISFVIFEIALLIFLLKPPITFQKDFLILSLFVTAALLGLLLYFFIAFVVGLLAFWYENAWGPFFLLTIFLEGFGGGLFPIDILPKTISSILLLTPFPYLIYFPSKLYLGTFGINEILQGFSVLIFWVVFMYILTLKILQAGLRYYSAVGH